VLGLDLILVHRVIPLLRHLNNNLSFIFLF
jgi:hypothetical protein